MSRSKLFWAVSILSVALTFLPSAIGRCDEKAVTVQELFQKVSANYDKIRTMRATFTTQHFMNDEKFYTMAGNKLIYKAPSKLRINLEGSKKKCMLYVDGYHIKRDSLTGKVKRIKRHAYSSTELPEEPSYWRDLRRYLEKYDDINILDRKGDIFVLELKPKPGSTLGLLGVLTLDYGMGVLRSLEYRDPGQDGKTTRIENWTDFISLDASVFYPKKFSYKMFVYDAQLSLIQTNLATGTIADLQINVPVSDNEFEL